MASLSTAPERGSGRLRPSGASRVTGLNRRLLQAQFVRSRRRRIYVKLARSLENNVALESALLQLYRRYSRDGAKPKDVSAVALYEWWRGVNDGHSLWHSAQGWIPAAELIQLKAGEQSARLVDALENIVELQKGVGEMTTKVVTATAYPVFVIGLVLFQFSQFGSDFIPQFVRTKPLEDWTGIGRTFAEVALFLADWLGLIAAGIVLAVLSVLFSMPRWTGGMRARFDSFGPWRVYRLINSVGLLLALAAMQRAGQSQVDSLRSFLSIAKPWLAERIAETLKQVGSGRLLGEAFTSSRLNFPDPEIRLDVEFYSTLPDLDDSLTLVAREALLEGEERATRIARTLSVSALVIAAAGVLFLFLGFQNMAGQMRVN